MTRLCVLLASSLLLGACHTPPAAAKPPPKKEAAEKDPMAISVTKVAGAVHLLAGRGGNIAAVVGPDGALIVDDQVPGLREQKAAGKKVEQVELDAKWASWGTGYIKTDRWIATIYESLN